MANIDFSKILGTVAGAAGSALLGPAGALAGPIVGAIGNGIFNAAAVERERAWSEKMYNKYNSPAALVRQYQEAGINPALMFGQSAIPAPTTSTAAQAPDNPFGDIVGSLGALMQLEMLDVNKRSVEADIANKEANTAGKNIENTVQSQFAALTAQASYDEILARIDNLRASEELTDYQREILGPLEAALKSAQASNLSSDTVYKNWVNGFIKEHGSDPNASPVLQLISSLMDNSKLNRPKGGKKSFGKSNNGGSR